MKLIVGLGNPGAKYHENRHNVGHMFVDWLKSHPDLDVTSGEGPEYNRILRSTQNDIRLIKTTVFMNQSGPEVKKLIAYYKLPTTDLIIAHDDLDIPLGKFKIKMGEGPQLHNGLTSIEKAFKTKDFWRIRIGVDNRQPDNRIDGETYVLQDFKPDEKKLLSQIFQQVVDKWRNVLHNE